VGLVRRLFDPVRVLSTPRAIHALISPNPRVIENDQWAKLLWAGLHLVETDLPSIGANMVHADHRRSVLTDRKLGDESQRCSVFAAELCTPAISTRP
jgi:hypothetical protein